MDNFGEKIAEVLIVFSVLGIMASIAIPHYITAKEIDSIRSKALDMCAADYRTVDYFIKDGSIYCRENEVTYKKIVLQDEED